MGVVDEIYIGECEEVGVEDGFDGGFFGGGVFVGGE